MDWRGPQVASLSRDVRHLRLPEWETQRHSRSTDISTPVAAGVSGASATETDSSKTGRDVRLSLGFLLNEAPPPPHSTVDGRELLADFAGMVVSRPPVDARVWEVPIRRSLTEMEPSARSLHHGRTRPGASAAQAAATATEPPTDSTVVPAPSCRSNHKGRAASKKATSQKPKKAKPMTYEKRRLARKCTIDGCFNYTINRGLCFRHGGGKQCTVDDCDASAKVAGLCWKHGGSVQCNVKGCDRRGKSRGLCWAHGGGTKCQSETCEKVAVSNGVCWAHGGGKRCLHDGCQRPAYERTFNYCPKHYKRYEEGDETVDV